MNDTITKNIINVFEEVKELSFDVLINNLKRNRLIIMFKKRMI